MSPQIWKMGEKTWGGGQEKKKSREKGKNEIKCDFRVGV